MGRMKPFYHHTDDITRLALNPEPANVRRSAKEERVLLSDKNIEIYRTTYKSEAKKCCYTWSMEGHFKQSKDSDSDNENH